MGLLCCFTGGLLLNIDWLDVIEFGFVSFGLGLVCFACGVGFVFRVFFGFGTFCYGNLIMFILIV